MCEFEKSIAYHCATTIVGLKCSNLLNCNVKKHGDIKRKIRKLEKKFAGTNIVFKEINKNKQTLLLVYQPEMIEEVLSNINVINFLSTYGYPSYDDNLFEFIEILSERIISLAVFPHEIGIFLGYPLEDVVGFIENRECKFSGFWKVYGDVNKAKYMFAKFENCRTHIMNLVYDGQELEQVFNL